MGGKNSGRGISDLSKLHLSSVRVTEIFINGNGNVGKELQKVRKFYKVTASAVARAMGYDESNISHFENDTGSSGGRYMSETAIKYAKVLGIKKITYKI